MTLSYLAPPSNWSPGATYGVFVDGRDADGGHTAGFFRFSVQP